jgi:CBS domain-containing protein
MSNLLLIILNDTKHLPEILEVWRELGVPGTTILKSAGAHATRNWLSAVGMGAIGNLFESKEVETRTLIAVFEDDDLLAQAIAEAERITGGFERPNSGVMVVLPVTKAIGVFKEDPKPVEEVSPPALRSNWEQLRGTPIELIDDVLKLEPTIVLADTSLDDVAKAMLAHPRVHVASVVSNEGRLLGLIELSVLADDLFFHVLPEEFLKDITDIDTMIEYAQTSRATTAKDAMRPPVWVKQDEKVQDAFTKMHDNKLSGLPIVNKEYRVVGYINLIELLSICIEKAQDIKGNEVN